jgi:hypothetical protein
VVLALQVSSIVASLASWKLQANYEAQNSDVLICQALCKDSEAVLEWILEWGCASFQGEELRGR